MGSAGTTGRAHSSVGHPNQRHSSVHAATALVSPRGGIVVVYGGYKRPDGRDPYNSSLI